MNLPLNWCDWNEDLIVRTCFELQYCTCQVSWLLIKQLLSIIGDRSSFFLMMTNFIKEPWDTPQRATATPKSCYPCKKSENFWQIRKKTKKSKNNWKKKTIHAFQNEIQKWKKREKTGNNRTNSTNKNNQQLTYSEKTTNNSKKIKKTNQKNTTHNQTKNKNN